MDVYTTEQEQVEMLRKWFKDYAPTIIIGAVLGLGAIYGWRYWQGLQAQKAEAASAQFETMLTQLADKGKRAEGVKTGDALTAQYGDTSYAGLTALALAKAAVEDNKLDEAAKQLRLVVNKPENAMLGHVARLRLARVLLAQDKKDEALALVSDSKLVPGEFLTGYEEVKGDIYAAMGKTAEARTAYQAAQAAQQQGQGNNVLLTMKLDQLAAAAPATGAGK